MKFAMVASMATGFVVLPPNTFQGIIHIYDFINTYIRTRCITYILYNIYKSIAIIRSEYSMLCMHKTPHGRRAAGLSIT